MRRRLSLKVKVPVLLVLAVLITATAATSLALYVGRGALESAAVEAAATSVQTYASAIRFYLDHAQSAIENLATLPSETPVNDPRGLRAARAVAGSLLAHSRVFDSVAFLAPDGRVLLIEPRAAERAQFRPDRAFAAWYAEVIRTRRTVVSDLTLSATTLRPTITVATPVRDSEGRLVGIWAGSLKLDELSRVGQAMSSSSPSYGFVTDRRGLVIAHRAQPRYVEHQTDFSSVPAVAAALAGATGSGRFVDPVERSEEIGAWTTLPGTGWAVVDVVPLDVALRSARQLTVSVAGASLILATVLGLVGFRFMRRIVGPLGRVTEAAGKIAAGASTEPIEAPTGDEVEQLARAFNRMTEALVDKDAALRQRAEELRKTNAELEAASRAKDQFLAMLGHELRNPLGAISNTITVLDRIGPQDGQARRLRDIAARQTRHLARLVDDLLDVARVSSGKIMLDRQAVDLKDVVERAVGALRATGRADQHRLSLSAQPVSVYGDATRLEQVVANLLDNAVKYTPPGSRIEVEVRAEGDAAMLRVRDDGPGIPAPALPHVFDMFTQADVGLDRSRGGLGLGLTLVRRLVELHGGTVTAASEGPDRGAEFSVRLPLDRSTSGPATTPLHAGATPARRVLVVEDNTDARESLRLLLEHAGHQVEDAEDGPAGCEAAQALRPDIALVDIGLPGLDGYEVARRLRADPATSKTFLVAVTGYGQPEDRRRAREAGFDAHLVKPVSPERLAEVLRAGAAHAVPQEGLHAP